MLNNVLLLLAFYYAAFPTATLRIIALRLYVIPFSFYRSRVSILTRDIDIAIMSVCLSVCPSVTFRYQMKTA